jgi:hypothetical protein
MDGIPSFVPVAFGVGLGGAGLPVANPLRGTVFFVVFNFGLELNTRPGHKGLQLATSLINIDMRTSEGYEQL